MTEAHTRAGMLALAIDRPGRAVMVAYWLLKGFWYKAYYPLRGIRFRAGRNLRVRGRLSVRGPGEVVFGNDVLVNGHVTPWTYDREARIVLGNNVMLGSTRFGCAHEIVVGDDCLLASAVLTDTDFHSTRADRRSGRAPVRVAPVRLARNVWVGENAALLPGAAIGENSVVGFATICMRPYPANVVILGNPGKVAGPIPAVAEDEGPAPGIVPEAATMPPATRAE